MESNLIKIPLRKTESIDLHALLKKIIDSEFYQSSSSFDSNLHELNNLRSSICTVITESTRSPNTITPESLGLFVRYYVQISSVELRFPSDSVAFKWTTTLSSDKKEPKTIEIKSFLFEKINILYNIACIYSQLALIEVSEMTQNEEKLKKSCVYFQYSSGVFNHLLTLIPLIESNLLPLELRYDTINSLKQLMLAQAQETIWFKALKTNLKDSVISKLSYQVSDYFLKSWSIANKTLTFDQMWCDYLSLKGIHFEAAAYYRSALSSNNAGKYGDAICYLRFANDLLKRVKSLHIDNVNMFEDVVRLENVIRNTLKKSERENDLIYLQQVPSLSQVPKLPKAVMVKPMITSELEDPITALNTSHDFGSTLFQGLIPFLVIQVSNSFQKRGEEFLTSNFEKPFQELDKNIDQSLSDLNIQSQIDAILKPQSIPNSILENYDRLKAVDGINYLNGLSLELNNLKLKSQQGVDHLLNQIAKEKAQDSELRQFYGTRQWKVSIDRLIELDNKVKVMRDYLIQSKSGDETIFRQIQELKPFLELYKSHERLSEYIPTADIVELNPDIKNIIFKLNEQIKTLNDLKVERSNYLELLRNKFNKIEVLPKLTREYHNQMSKNKTITTDELESVVQTELETFNSDLKYLSLTKSTQVELTNNLYNSCSSFEQYKHHLKISRKREEALKVLNDTTNGFFEVVGNLKQGHQFYSQLLEGLNEIQKDLDAFLQSLEIEKNLIISKLESDNSN